MKRLVSLILLLAMFCPCLPQCQAKSNYDKNRQEGIAQNEILGISRTTLNNYTVKVGDPFTAVIAEEIKKDNQVLIPTGSIITGSVTKIKLPKRMPLRAGKIILTFDQIKMPDGHTIPLAKDEIAGYVVSPYVKSLRSNIATELPSRAGGYGLSIPLTCATDLNNAVAYVSGLGATVILGAATGLVEPDVGKTRLQTALKDAIYATPIGILKFAFGKGEAANIKTGDGLVFKFDPNTIDKIDNQFVMVSNKPTVVSKIKINSCVN